jgi:hypothetical protein
MTQVHLVTQFHILKPACKQPTPTPSTEAWNLALQSGHVQTIPLPSIHTPLCIPNLVFDTNASYLTLYFFMACVGCNVLLTFLVH